MMHGWGMGGLGMGFSLIGMVPLILLGGGLYLFYRYRRGNGASNDVREIEGRTDIAKVFRLAKEHNGVLTVSDVVSDLEMDPGEAERLLDSQSNGHRVEMTVDNDGIVRYIFREFRS